MDCWFRGGALLFFLVSGFWFLCHALVSTSYNIPSFYMPYELGLRDFDTSSPRLFFRHVYPRIPSLVNLSFFPTLLATVNAKRGLLEYSFFVLILCPVVLVYDRRSMFVCKFIPLVLASFVLPYINLPKLDEPCIVLLTIRAA